MANSNVNIADKIFAYIRHGSDLIQPIKDVYNNSLIFIGDEERIYVPVINTYVGIGKFAYTDTVNAIDALNSKIDDLANTLASDLVAKMYVDWNFNTATQFFDSDHNEYAQAGGNNSAAKQAWDEQFALNNEITLRGVHDYDPTTGFSYSAANAYYVAKGKTGTFTAVKDGQNVAAATYSTSSVPTSGITLTPHWGAADTTTNPFTGQSVTKYYGNWIEIDDKLTWSYMTSAYAYTMRYSQNYTDSEIDRLYHDLLGVGESTYLPVSIVSVFENVSDYVNNLTPAEQADYVDETNPAHPTGKIVAWSGNSYWTIEENAQYYLATYTVAEGLENSAKHYVAISPAELEAWIQGAALPTLAAGEDYVLYGNEASLNGLTGNVPQLYVLDTVYNSTYNMNIADGIQTLKEVAYLLDLLSDGTLGSTTYVTYEDFNTAYPGATFTGGVYTNGDNVTYTLINPNEAPAANENYVFYTNTANPENLGIQIAYSIAGNQKQIEDLHYHVELAEEGKTSLRSIQSTSENFGELELLGGTRNWVNTDTNQVTSQEDGYLNSNINNSYLVGDVNLKLKLNTAYTYVTVYGDGSSNPVISGDYTALFGTQWKGTYTMADMGRLGADSSAYYYEESPGVFGNAWGTAGHPFHQDPHTQSEGEQYWWIPTGSTQDVTNNAVYTRISKEDWEGTAIGDPLAGTSIIKNSVADPVMYYRNDNGEYVSTAGDPTTAPSEMLYFISGHDTTVVHAALGENRLATTEWVGAYVVSNMSSLKSDLDDILASAYEYTNKQINKLDAEYKYSDFHDRYWAAYYTEHLNGISYVDNTYITAYEREYTAFKEASANRVYLNGAYLLSYQSNSQYLFNVKEENGIVTAEARELPTDKIKAETKVWGAEVNFDGERHVYVAIDGLTASSDLLTQLYHHGHPGDNQVFVETTEKSYQLIASDESGFTIPATGTYWFNSDANVFEEYIPENLSENAMGDYTDTGDIKWKQLYRKVNTYLELNLDDADDETATTTSVVIGDYTLTYADGEVAVTGGNAVANAKLLKIGTRPAEKVEYLTTESKHFSYDENGHGENELTVKANITKLEDATETNSGFADAYDVKTYIHNILKFVDISATVTEDIVATSAKYHKQISLAYYTAYVQNNAGLSAEEKKLYYSYSTANSGRFTEIANPSTAYYWADDNSWKGTYEEDENISTNAHAVVANSHGQYSYLTEEFNMQGITNDAFVPGSHNYYVRIEFAKTNAQNLNETTYR